MNKEIVEKGLKMACYVGLGVCTLGKMWFDKKDKESAVAEAITKMVEAKTNENK